MTPDEYIEKLKPILASRSAEQKARFAGNLKTALDWSAQYAKDHAAEIKEWCEKGRYEDDA